MSGGATHALLERCRAGDASAWDELVRLHRRLVYSVPRGAGLAADACDDVFQETFAILLRRLPEIRSGDALPKWLATTARHVTLRRLRSERRRADRDRARASEPVLDAGDLESALERWERLSAVRDAFAALGERCRELLRLLLVEGTSDYRSIGERLGMPVGSIGPTRARCMARLLEGLRDLGWTDPSLERCISRASAET